MPIGPLLRQNLVNWSHPLNVGRVTWLLALPWRFGPTWYDLCGRNQGTLTNVVPGATSGWKGPSRPGGFGELLFDGTDDYVVTSAPVTPSHTIAAWARLDAAGNYPMITSGVANVGGGLELRFNGGSRQPEYATSANSVTSPTALTLGTWHRLVATSDNATYILYVDGRQVATAAAAAITSGTITSLGGRGASLFLQGAIDDLTVLNVVWSAAEVALDYWLGPRSYPGVLNRAGLPAWAGTTAAAPAALAPGPRQLNQAVKRAAYY